MQNAAKIFKEVKKAVIGKDEIIHKILMVMLANGHVLLEDIPGVGKTNLALAFSKALGLDTKRSAHRQNKRHSGRLLREKYLVENQRCAQGIELEIHKLQRST